MNYYKLTNVVKENGSIDYKGLNKNANVAGSQFYDLTNNFCILINSQKVTGNDIREINQEEYETLKQQLQSDEQVDELTVLRQENTTLQLAVSEITMYVAEQDLKIEAQNQVISELSLLLAGGTV